MNWLNHPVLVGPHHVFWSINLIALQKTNKKNNKKLTLSHFPGWRIVLFGLNLISVSKFDLLKGYYQVLFSARAQEVSSFIIPSRLFSYTVMSFGLWNAPATFQGLMKKVVAGLEGLGCLLG